LIPPLPEFLEEKKMKVRWMFILLLLVTMLASCAQPTPPPAQVTEAPPVATEAMPTAEPPTAPPPAEPPTAVPPTEPPPPQELTFWMMKTFVDDANTAVEERVKVFEQENNAKVEVRMIAIDDLYPQWAAAIESGNVPDVTYCGYEDAGKFFNQGVLTDLSDITAQIQADNGPMNEAVIKAGTFDGKNYAVPMWAEPSVLYYRTDLFEKAGIAAPPSNWEEFLADAKLLTDEAAGVYGAGFGLGRDNSDSEWWMRDIIWGNGASLFNETGDAAAINSPEGQVAFQWLKDFWTTENVNPPGVIGWDDGGNNGAYLSGQVAMIKNTGSVYRRMTEEMPEMLEVSGFALVPEGPQGRFVTGISNHLCVFNGAKNPELGKQLIAFLSDKEWQREWMKLGGYLLIPPYNDLIEDEFWQTDIGQVFGSTPQFFAFLGHPGPYTPSAGQVATDRLLTAAMEEVVVNNMPIEEALQKLSDEINAVIAASK
jgi:multiple sugar transport system substrate-binding protein